MHEGIDSTPTGNGAQFYFRLPKDGFVPSVDDITHHRQLTPTACDRSIGLWC